jgi:hypothetical protein
LQGSRRDRPRRRSVEILDEGPDPGRRAHGFGFDLGFGRHDGNGPALRNADLLSNTDRTWPVIVEPPDLIVAVRPLNCAMRKRRTSFWSLVSKVNMKPFLCSRDYRRLLLAVYENIKPYKYGRAAPERRRWKILQPD